MRTLFLIPPRTTLLHRDFASTHIAPSLGLASMIGHLQTRFPDITVLDAYAEKLSLKATVKRILDFNPDVLGISAITVQIHDAADVVSALKASGAKAKCVVGGAHASRIPEDTLLEFPQFDYVAAGEGEGIMMELLEALDGDSSTDDIKGLYALRDGSIVTGGDRAFIDNLDELEFPEWKHFTCRNYCALFSLRSKSLRELSVSSMRGCPYNCIFCAKTMGNKVRMRSVPLVVDEIQRDVNVYGAQQIFLTDESFTVDRDRAAALCEDILRREIQKKIVWSCITRPDMIDEPLLALMKKAGCRYMCFGADSISDEVLEYLEKDVAADEIVSAVRMCGKHGIVTQVGYILGLPSDSASSIKKTIRAAVKIDSDFATFSILVPYPGTKVMEMAERGDEGLVLLSKDWRLYGKQMGYALETKYLNRVTLEKYQRMANYRFYLRPRKIQNAFKMANPRIIFYYFVSHLLKRIGIKPAS